MKKRGEVLRMRKQANKRMQPTRLAANQDHRDLPSKVRENGSTIAAPSGRLMRGPFSVARRRLTSTFPGLAGARPFASSIFAVGR